MNVIISQNIVQKMMEDDVEITEANSYASVAGRTGRLANTFNIKGIPYVEVKLDDIYWKIPRKYCLISLRNTKCTNQY